MNVAFYFTFWKLVKLNKYLLNCSKKTMLQKSKMKKAALLVLFWWRACAVQLHSSASNRRDVITKILKWKLVITMWENWLSGKWFFNFITKLANLDWFFEFWNKIRVPCMLCIPWQSFAGGQMRNRSRRSKLYSFCKRIFQIRISDFWNYIVLIFKVKQVASLYILRFVAELGVAGSLQGGQALRQRRLRRSVRKMFFWFESWFELNRFTKLHLSIKNFNLCFKI